jgi:protein-S-isoprenylcysteine O-methyltransferase Ste14
MQLHVIHSVFNNKTIRRVLLKLRVPLALLFIVALATQVKPSYFLAGIIVSLVGELIQVWCFASLKKQKELATKGPYMLVRNPMYLGRYLLILGGTLLTGNIWIIIAFSIIYYFYAVNRVRREEETLRKIFGHTYDRYCEKVSRFFPSFGSADWKSLWFFKWELFIQNHGHWNLLLVLLCYATFYCLAFHR